MWITVIKALAGIFAFFFAIRFLQLMPIVFRLLQAKQKGKIDWPGPVVADPNKSLREADELINSGSGVFPSFIKYTFGLGIVAIFLTWVSFDFFGMLWPTTDSALRFYGVSFIGGLIGGFVSMRETGYMKSVILKLLS